MARVKNKLSLMDRVRIDNGEVALRKGKFLKVYSAKDLKFYLDNGWTIISHTPTGYLTNQYWLLDKKTS